EQVRNPKQLHSPLGLAYNSPNPIQGVFMSQESDLNRRDFLKTGAGLAALSGITFITHPERVFGANDRVQVAICGLRGRGVDHVKEYAKIPQAQIAAFCDVDENVTKKRLSEMEAKGLPKPKTYVDVRELLHDKSIDAISIS